MKNELNSNKNFYKFLSPLEVVFWDFDGTIKDTNNVKADAFEKLFQDFGLEMAKKVREHHIANGGISRYEKISLYLDWVGANNKKQLLERYAEDFGKMVCEEVVNANWIEGVKDYIFSNYQKQKFVIVTATPQKEIEYILSSIGVNNLFYKIYGYPMTKVNAILDCINKINADKNVCSMVGDSKQDRQAANASGITFFHVDYLTLTVPE